MEYLKLWLRMGADWEALKIVLTFKRIEKLLDKEQKSCIIDS